MSESLVYHCLYNSARMILTIPKFSIFISYSPPADNAQTFLHLICIMYSNFWILIGVLYHAELYLFWYTVMNLTRVYDILINELITYILSAKLVQLSSSTWPGKLSNNKWNWLAPQNTAFRIASFGVSKHTIVWKIK